MKDDAREHMEHFCQLNDLSMAAMAAAHRENVWDLKRQLTEVSTALYNASVRYAQLWLDYDAMRVRLGEAEHEMRRLCEHLAAITGRALDDFDAIAAASMIEELRQRLEAK